MSREYVLFVVLVFLANGLVARYLSHGHWFDATQRPPLPFQISLALFAQMLLLFAGALLMALFAGVWGVCLLGMFVLWWAVNRGISL